MSCMGRRNPITKILGFTVTSVPEIKYAAEQLMSSVYKMMGQNILCQRRST